MAIFNNPLGINLTNHDPLTDSPYSYGYDDLFIVPPPGSEYMITENGLFMQTESGFNLMVTE